MKKGIIIRRLPWGLLILMGVGMVAVSAWINPLTSSWAGSVSPPPVQVDDRSPEFHIYELPVGTPLPLALHTPISTAVNLVNDPVEAAITQDFYLGTSKMITKDSRLQGYVSVAERPMQGRNGLLAIRFDSLTLVNGERVTIQAYVKTERPDHAWGGQLTPGTEPKQVTHRVLGIGAYNRTVMGGPREMGRHIEFWPGERMTLILETPISLVIPQEDYTE